MGWANPQSDRARTGSTDRIGCGGLFEDFEDVPQHFFGFDYHRLWHLDPHKFIETFKSGRIRHYNSCQQSNARQRIRIRELGNDNLCVVIQYNSRYIFVVELQGYSQIAKTILRQSGIPKQSACADIDGEKCSLISFTSN